jgi:hypothetical protein
MTKFYGSFRNASVGKNGGFPPVLFFFRSFLAMSHALQSDWGMNHQCTVLEALSSTIVL